MTSWPPSALSGARRILLDSLHGWQRQKLDRREDDGEEEEVDTQPHRLEVDFVAISQTEREFAGFFF